MSTILFLFLFLNTIYGLTVTTDTSKVDISTVPLTQEEIADNYRPYLKRIKIIQNMTERYAAEWIEEEKMLKLVTKKQLPINIQKPIYLHLTFNENVQILKPENIKIGSEIADYVKITEDASHYVIGFSTSKIILLNHGFSTISIEAKDLADNELLELTSETVILPNKLIVRNQEGAIISKGGSDKLHRIFIDKTIPTIKISTCFPEWDKRSKHENFHVIGKIESQDEISKILFTLYTDFECGIFFLLEGLKVPVYTYIADQFTISEPIPEGIFSSYFNITVGIHAKTGKIKAAKVTITDLAGNESSDFILVEKVSYGKPFYFNRYDEEKKTEYGCMWSTLLPKISFFKIK